MRACQASFRLYSLDASGPMITRIFRPSKALTPEGTAGVPIPQIRASTTIYRIGPGFLWDFREKFQPPIWSPYGDLCKFFFQRCRIYVYIDEEKGSLVPDLMRGALFREVY